MTDLLRVHEVAERLRVPVGTLRQWRQRNVGPASARIGRHIVYRESDVQAFVEERFAADAARHEETA